MIQTATPADAARNDRVQRSPEGASATGFIGKPGIVSRESVAYLVWNPPHYRTPPHFHDVNQFQIVIGGTARVGKHEVARGSVHYVDAGTPYGPIMSGDEGFSYFTLRQTAPAGYYIMPGARHLMKRKAGRNLIAEAGFGPDQSGSVELFSKPDGLSACQLTAAAGMALPIPDIRHGGAFTVILDGEVTLDGQTYPERSCIQIGADDGIPAMIVGKDGATAMFMSFPRNFAPASEIVGQA